MSARQRALVRAPAARPAETAGLGGGVVAVIAAALGASPTLVAVLAGLAGVLPTAVTFVVTHGGIRGTLSLLWQGTPSKD